jgi:hypothetical protein
MRKVRLILLSLSLMSIGVAVTENIQAQRKDLVEMEIEQGRQNVKIERAQQKVEDIDRRVGVIEGQRADARLAHLETIADVNRDLLIAIALGLAALIGEAFSRLVARIRKGIPA